jgi:hypothetical protein
MGIKGGHKGNNSGFGNLTTLRVISSSNTTNSTTDNKNKIPKTSIIRISEPLYRRFVGHSRRYYNVETYETILENLIKCYEERHQDTYWYHNTG